MTNDATTVSTSAINARIRALRANRKRHLRDAKRYPLSGGAAEAARCDQAIAEYEAELARRGSSFAPVAAARRAL